MADPTKQDGKRGSRPDSTGDADLSARLKSLDARLDQVSAQRQATKETQTGKTSDSNALGQALRLSAEFISGVAAGGIIGWLVDRLFGTSPWGLVVCIILGFCAGMLNLFRAAGMVKPARPDQKR